MLNRHVALIHSKIDEQLPPNDRLIAHVILDAMVQFLSDISTIADVARQRARQDGIPGYHQ